MSSTTAWLPWHCARFWLPWPGFSFLVLFVWAGGSDFLASAGGSGWLEFFAATSVALGVVVVLGVVVLLFFALVGQLILPWLSCLSWGGFW